ncbi:WRIP1-like protein, partial [Mya arenaria]
MSAENVLPCPICAKSFSSDTINQHLDNCLNPGDSIQLADTLSVPQSKKRKSDQDESSGKGWGFLMGPSSGVGSKRPKLGKPGEQPRSSKTIVIDADEDSNDNHSDGKIEQCKIEIEVSPVERTAHSLRKESTAETNVLSNASQSKTSTIDMGIPLAEQMRPSSLEMYIGQDKAVGKEKMLAHLLSSDVVPSMILWGPPGCGKTTLAKIIAHKCKIKSKFVQLSATSSGVNDVKEVIKKAKNDYKMLRKRTILFLDEIHRFNKLQQDSLLPHVEDGTITLIGATTENPSFQVNSALLSRCRVIVLEKLDADAVMKILVRAVERLDFEIIEEKEEKSKVTRCIEKTALDFLANVCDGDARVALNGLQVVIQSQLATVTNEMKTVVITTNH